jgi:hypothetical protein
MDGAPVVSMLGESPEDKVIRLVCSRYHWRAPDMVTHMRTLMRSYPSGQQGQPSLMVLSWEIIDKIFRMVAKSDGLLFGTVASAQNICAWRAVGVDFSYMPNASHYRSACLVDYHAHRPDVKDKALSKLTQYMLAYVVRKEAKKQKLAPLFSVITNPGHPNKLMMANYDWITWSTPSGAPTANCTPLTAACTMYNEVRDKYHPPASFLVQYEFDVATTITQSQAMMGFRLNSQDLSTINCVSKPSRYGAGEVVKLYDLFKVCFDPCSL